VALGAAILGWVGGEMLLKDGQVQRWLGEDLLGVLHWVVPAVLAVGVVPVGLLIKNRRLARAGAHPVSTA
jgi:hypothetical protein